MATQTAGIQQLLAAEKKAAETVAEARKSLSFIIFDTLSWTSFNNLKFSSFKGRVKRLKQAKDEAVSEIESYKNEQDKKHKHLETTVIFSADF